VHEGSLKWFVNDTPSKKDIILSGLGWGRLPAHMVDKEINSKRLVHLTQLEDDDDVTIYLCKKKNKSIGKVAKFIWDSF
jgi:DNA-binding transcriptional LysR family regulator